MSDLPKVNPVTIVYDAEKYYDFDPSGFKRTLPTLKTVGGGIADILLPQDATDVAMMAVPPVVVVSASTLLASELKVPKSKTALAVVPVAEVFNTQLLVIVALTVKVPVAVAACAALRDIKPTVIADKMRDFFMVKNLFTLRQ